MEESDHDILLRLDERVDAILKRLEKGDQCIDDLKTRVSRLESFQATLVGIAATVSFVLTLVWDKFGKLFGSGG